ncbi:hypothetical protein NPIL_568971 [Nephila pilipes]|uniref:Uncharacterized protein n=1 Tax=Nephila pilipes TaxID=299642 RepID=A0A8X6Q709_NEPPI|nr:hypothetical protein NPIL_568971 [Nephila pilipes]
MQKCCRNGWCKALKIQLARIQDWLIVYHTKNLSIGIIVQQERAAVSFVLQYSLGNPVGVRLGYYDQVTLDIGLEPLGHGSLVPTSRPQPDLLSSSHGFEAR